MEPNTPSVSRTKKYADKVVCISLLLLVFLTPVFFVPSSNVAFDSAKLLLLYLVVTIAFLAWIIARLQEGKAPLPIDWFFVTLGLIPFSFLISATFSGYRSLSFFGHGTEIQTFAFMLAAALLTFIVSIVFSSRKAITYCYLAFLVTFPIVIIFQIFRLIDPSQTIFGVFAGTTTSLLGTWNDLGIYCGLMAIFAFIALELLSLETLMRSMLIAVIIVALFFLAIINFTLIWYVLGGLALIFFVYNFSLRRFHSLEKPEKPTRSLPLVSLILVIVSLVFIIIPSTFYSILPSYLQVNNVEIRPSWSSTFLVAAHTPAGRILTGPGPSRFVNEWVASKPLDINQTVFWSTDFTAGISAVSTAIVETGLIGLISWLVFFFFLISIGIRSIFKKTDPVRRYLLISSFVTSLYLWIFALLYTPSASIMVLTFLFTGIFLATTIEAGFVKNRIFNFVENPKTSFLAVLAFLVLVFGSLGFCYVSIKRFAAETYFNRSLASSNAGNFSAATASLDEAISLNPAADYFAADSTLNVTALDSTVSSLSNQTSPSPTLQNQARSYITVALSSAQTAVATDPTSYQNWLVLGQAYDVLFQLGETDALTPAQNAYNQAATLAPSDPVIPLTIARLDLENKDDADAKTETLKALTLKGNYTDAVFLLSQIQASQGDLPSAIQSVQALAEISPNDPTVYFELGLLQYDTKDYADAASALNEAESLEPDYANAKYFLGLSDYYLGQTQAAITQFEDLLSSNPGNSDLTTILNNLEAGMDPFANVPPPQNNPTKLKTPPLQDTGSTKTKSPAVTGQ